MKKIILYALIFCSVIARSINTAPETKSNNPVSDLYEAIKNNNFDNAKKALKNNMSASADALQVLFDTLCSHNSLFDQRITKILLDCKNSFSITKIIDLFSKNNLYVHCIENKEPTQATININETLKTLLKKMPKEEITQGFVNFFNQFSINVHNYYNQLKSINKAQFVPNDFFRQVDDLIIPFCKEAAKNKNIIIPPEIKRLIQESLNKDLISALVHNQKDVIEILNQGANLRTVSNWLLEKDLTVHRSNINTAIENSALEQNTHAFNPVDYPTKNNYLHVLSFFEKNASLNEKLYFYSGKNDLTSVQNILKNNAISLESFSIEQLFERFISFDNWKAVDWLLNKYNISINKKYAQLNNNTLLHLASFKNAFNTIHYLLKNSANAYVYNNEYIGAININQWRKLLEQFGHIDTKLTIKMLLEDLNTVEELIKNGADPFSNKAVELTPIAELLASIARQYNNIKTRKTYLKILTKILNTKAHKKDLGQTCAKMYLGPQAHSITGLEVCVATNIPESLATWIAYTDDTTITKPNKNLFLFQNNVTYKFILELEKTPDKFLTLAKFCLKHNAIEALEKIIADKKIQFSEKNYLELLAAWNGNDEMFYKLLYSIKKHKIKLSQNALDQTLKTSAEKLLDAPTHKTIELALQLGANSQTKNQSGHSLLDWILDATIIYQKRIGEPFLSRTLTVEEAQEVVEYCRILSKYTWRDIPLIVHCLKKIYKDGKIQLPKEIRSLVELENSGIPGYLSNYLQQTKEYEKERIKDKIEKKLYQSIQKNLLPKVMFSLEDKPYKSLLLFKLIHSNLQNKLIADGFAQNIIRDLESLPKNLQKNNLMNVNSHILALLFNQTYPQTEKSLQSILEEVFEKNCAHYNLISLTNFRKDFSPQKQYITNTLFKKRILEMLKQNTLEKEMLSADLYSTVYCLFQAMNLIKDKKIFYKIMAKAKPIVQDKINKTQELYLQNLITQMHNDLSSLS